MWTPKIEEKLRNPRLGSKIAAAKEYGVDLTLIIENLKLTPTERVLKMQQAALTFAKIREANPSLRRK